MGNVIIQDDFIEKLLVEREAYEFLKKTKLTTAGYITLFYIHADKLLGDGGKWEEFEGDARDMIKHAWGFAESYDLDFGTVIARIGDYIDKFLESNKDEDFAISGDQRRGWIFSGPVSIYLEVPHISIYKDGRMEIMSRGGVVKDATCLKGRKVVHITDLLNQGSSAYRVEDGIEKGWIYWLRNKKAEVEDFVSIVTRLQGGEDRLNGLSPPVKSHSFVAIDEDFLRLSSKNNEEERAASEYAKDFFGWGGKYIREHGALAFVDYFDPKNKKTDRAMKFLDNYRDVLEETGALESLAKTVEKKYNRILPRTVQTE